MKSMEERFMRIESLIKNGVYLFGAGANGEWVHDYCKRSGINVIAFIDSDKQKQNTLIDGKNCISYEDYLKNNSERVVFITAKHAFRQIYEKYCDNPLIMPFDTWFCIKNEENYKKIRFEDEKSYKTLEGILNYLLTGEKRFLWSVSENGQYFSVSPFFGGLNEVFVDLGAYTGDSIERFIYSVMGDFKKVYVFEPGSSQLNALNKRMDRLAQEWAIDKSRIIEERLCIGSKKCMVPFSFDGFEIVNRVTDYSETIVEMTTLDNYFENKDVTFIKTDIEGSDYDAIVGGENLIRRCRPKIAISIYHKPDDILRTVHLLDSWCLGYKYKLRHHANVCTDTVLYCYVEE